ncbi:MAG: lipoyl synthase [Piscirickettsiaceae bacterium CG_4_9_14_3_um_filter_43_564]|nr:lipoyl synthase [Thiomicrospira sp.]OIP94046.1 MAG: lipoyl synthase [Thiomicrospira sp. CG2_30_44_34]PIQ05490.1 MAG: lipoyl synthase [Piscirickettsiaceae bacterium CG18_big_fil_WC_8_21_14_2_50_44_103]PIU39243.1 MAG: lipoyl synthase [Piscirickettsiaceae bacterium CG07_land_8_20_14_0_80_44_28]PIW58280.1 MAG: lipoyl synthase [Piscirickettsiaceae bacterium CG12_big_fil_rev_8_21_14_0_65_44_934]PIW77008.1 MAG: lipoyl synthase [Piscirickettsiaceae bacterium CG_4_8_14_3_um_filter_44_38]PIX80783.1 
MSAPQYQEIAVEQLTQSLKSRKANMSKGEYKTKSLKNKPDPGQPKLKKPAWIKAKLPPAKHIGRVKELKTILRQQGLNSVCEEASCPNLGECFGHGTATFMVMGHICTRKCPFCDVTHGRPKPLNAEEPLQLAKTIAAMNLNYVVITSVDRDDLRDGGAQHFSDCISAIRQQTPKVKIETLVPDFRGRLTVALNTLAKTAPDIMNHNLETIPRLYADARPGADYQASLTLLKTFKQLRPETLTKSGLMVGLGESFDEIIDVMQDLRAHQVDMLTIGQYLQPSDYHLPVQHYWTPEAFKQLEIAGIKMGFQHVASGPMVRSSYHADLQAQGQFSE